MTDIVVSKVEKFLNTEHNNNLNLATPLEVRIYWDTMNYIGNLKKNKEPDIDCITTNIIMYCSLKFFFFSYLFLSILCLITV